MSPSSRDLNAARPAPLKIHKDSHLIQKATSSSSTTTTASSSSSTGTAINNNSNSNTNNNNNNNNNSSSSSNYHHPPPRQQPVIIYTHSPKIIHTHARDFMALVQKLTGLDSSSAASSTSTSSSPPPPPPPPPRPPPPQPPSTCGFKDNCNNSSSLVTTPTQDDSASSSENCMVNNAEAPYVGCSSLSSTIMPSRLGFDHQMPPPPPPPPFMSDVPFFTPGHGDLFCSPAAFYRYPDSAMFSPQVPNVGGPFSPSVMEAMRTLSDY